MYAVNLDNRFYRVFAVRTDKYGIDPLRDKLAEKLRAVTAYHLHEVTQDERGAPELISLREYGNEDFWWHILNYNAICRFRVIVEGMTLRIPDIGGIVGITNDRTADSSPSGENITII